MCCTLTGDGFASRMQLFPTLWKGPQFRAHSPPPLCFPWPKKVSVLFPLVPLLASIRAPRAVSIPGLLRYTTAPQEVTLVNPTKCRLTNVLMTSSDTLGLSEELAFRAARDDTGHLERNGKSCLRRSHLDSLAWSDSVCVHVWAGVLCYGFFPPLKKINMLLARAMLALFLAVPAGPAEAPGVVFLNYPCRVLGAQAKARSRAQGFSAAKYTPTRVRTSLPPS